MHYACNYMWIALTVVALTTINRPTNGEWVSSSVDISHIFLEAGIISDVIDAIGNVDVNVTFPSGAIVRHGNQLTTTEAKYKPSAIWSAEPGAFYTLILCDPDAPSRYLPLIREYFHWMVMNIVDGDAVNGETIFEYAPPEPPLFTGLHRYVVLVFKQPSGYIQHKETFVQGFDRWSRLGLSSRQFARKYQLGKPIGGNFLVAKYDSDICAFFNNNNL